MADTATPANTGKSKGALLAKAASFTKNILGTGPAAPQTVKVPQAVSEIHVSPDDVIPAGTILTEEVIKLADLSDEALESLTLGGHVKLVEVYAMALPDADEAEG